MTTRILGLGHHLPAEQEIVGVRRPIVPEAVGPSTLVLGPARDALGQAGLTEGDIELIIFATMTPDVTFPGSACFLQNQLACGTVGALDIRAQCAGFLFGLMVADGFLRVGKYERILLAAAEVHSSGLDYSERGARVARLYGDGAAATLLGRDGKGRGLQAVVCHTDGRSYDRFWCEYPASRHHPTRMRLEEFRERRHFPTLDFDAVTAFGREHLPAVVREVLARASARAEEVDCYILSHILSEVVEESAAALGIPESKLIDSGRRHGHLTAATLPLALSEARSEGTIGEGARVCLATCGAGFAWGAALLTV
jgi:3-oxoacyl-[acyl-carrier-protein] synthase III